MSARPIFAAVLLVLFAGIASPQGFAGLGENMEGFALPDPTTEFTFPKDHGPHSGFRIEWWYVTANLRDPDGVEYGVQWTLFRNALTASGMAADQVWMAHAAISAPSGHYFAQRLSRGGFGTAGVSAAPFEAYLDEWFMRGPSLGNMKIFAQGSDFAFELKSEKLGGFVPQGANGYSVKSDAGLASHYYSLPHIQVEGKLSLPEGDIDVAGLAWLDREWSSQPLTETQSGWDWIALHFDSGDKLMGYRLRDQKAGNYTVGTWIPANGPAVPLQPDELTMTPTNTSDVAGRDIPTSWHVSLPSKNVAVDVIALYPDSWMPTFIPYWEGPVTVSGSHIGRGYLEMTGYE